MESIVIAAGKRTPFGAFGGSLKDVGATQLGVIAARGTIEAHNIKASEIEHFVIGNVVQSGSDAAYVPRHIGLHLGSAIHVGALGVNRLCGSGFQSIINSAQMVLSGDGEIILAGGVEQMSQIPYILRSARWGTRMGNSEIEDYMTSALTDQYSKTPMAITAENLAENYSINREECDQHSVRSQTRFKNALDKGYFREEIVPVRLETKAGTTDFITDEHAKPNVTIDKVRTMKSLFKKDGVVTAATASGIVDGAAACLVMPEATAKRRNLKSLARLVSWAAVGCEPHIMGIGPVLAIRKALEKCGLTLAQMDLVEVNEAFSGQYLSVEKELKLNPEITNVNGGAIAVGHPLGASGTRIMNHLVYELHRRKGKYAVGSACIGGGQGIAIVIERI
ncbi:MAG: beta-ketoadipyl CoA thiolase [Proteobacteria bacterium SG_bin7]|nr:MAG: beta-ketoadipyl CoA thiolase [Proteobacteria bacterium SG_bin7]